VQNDPVEQFDLRWRVWGSELGRRGYESKFARFVRWRLAAVSSIYCSRVTVFRRSESLAGDVEGLELLVHESTNPEL
jgi:hypothetical protein